MILIDLQQICTHGVKSETKQRVKFQSAIKPFLVFFITCQFIFCMLSGQIRNDLKISIDNRMRMGNFILYDANEIYDGYYVYFTIENISNSTRQITIPSAIEDVLFIKSSSYMIFSKTRAFEKIRTWDLKPNQKLILPRFLFIPKSKITKGLHTFLFEFVWVPYVRESFMFHSSLMERKRNKLNILACQLNMYF